MSGEVKSTGDMVQGWLKSGGNANSPEQAADALTGKEDLSPATENSEQEVRSENSTTEDILPGGEDTQKDSKETEEQLATGSKEATPGTSKKEVITVTDDQGRRRKIEIDYSDRMATRKAHEMAAGFRKMQAERDQLVRKEKESSGKFQEVNTNWQLLEKAFSQKGIEGVVDLLEGRSGAYQDNVKKGYERQKFLESASPQELKALEAQEAAETARRENARIRKENEEFKEQITKERETAELRSLESRVHPVFNKYRFAEKLGDNTDEHMFDEMLWNTALKRLEPYEEKGLDLTPEMIEREFHDVAKSIRNRIRTQANKTAARTVEQKKTEATENVQAAVKSGYKQGGAAKEARELINNGNLSSLLKNWGKYGGLFNK